MANNWKICVFFAGLAFCISFLFGLIGGVEFATLILRAFLGAVVFGGLSLGADLLLRRFLPELFASAGENDGGIDITVPEINPHERSGEDEELSGGDEAGEAFGGREEEEDSDDLVEEIEELPRSEADAPAGSPDPGDAPAPAAREADAGGGEVKGPDPAAAGPEDVEDLDVLPDVGELDASFAAAAEEEGGEEDSGILAKVSSASSSRNAKAAAITDDQNPALLAKALQTVIKRDK
jgi:hypothetical protein